MTGNYSKPIPVPQGESDFYWEKTKKQELWLRKCDDCGEPYFYPRDISPCCFSKKYINEASNSMSLLKVQI